LTFNAGNNRINDGIRQYDAAGNMTADGTHGYVYDLEGRITCILGTDGTCTSNTATLYFYDAGGARVGKQQANGLEDYVYDSQGHMTSVHDSTSTLVRAELYTPDGGHVATKDSNGLFFTHADWLGTERVRSNASGTAFEWCTDTPYGMNTACAGTDTSPMHFTGLQYDAETGMSHTLNRQYPMNLARWLTPDPGGLKVIHLEDPQTWNLYAYVRNNPLTLTDPTGLVGGGAQDCNNGICENHKIPGPEHWWQRLVTKGKAMLHGQRNAMHPMLKLGEKPSGLRIPITPYPVGSSRPWLTGRGTVKGESTFTVWAGV
jgi:RHS repeat-associated protein